jgi:glutamine synthetase
VCLAAGLDGIKNQLSPSDSVDKNIYALTTEEREILGVRRLPANLCEAVADLENSEFIKNVLGDHISKKYIEAKKVEWEDYRTQVTQWELDQYLYRI